VNCGRARRPCPLRGWTRRKARLLSKAAARRSRNKGVGFRSFWKSHFPCAINRLGLLRWTRYARYPKLESNRHQCTTKKTGAKVLDSKRCVKTNGPAWTIVRWWTGNAHNLGGETQSEPWGGPSFGLSCPNADTVLEPVRMVPHRPGMANNRQLKKKRTPFCGPPRARDQTNLSGGCQPVYRGKSGGDMMLMARGFTQYQCRWIPYRRPWCWPSGEGPGV